MIKRLLVLISLIVLPFQSMAYMTFQKWSWENTMTYPLQESQVQTLEKNSMVQWYTLDDPRVKISEEWLIENQWPQQWSHNFELEMVITALAAYYAKNSTYFTDTKVPRHLFEVQWLDQSQPFVSDILSKYNVQTAGDLAELVHNDRPTQLIDDTFERLAKRWAERRPWLLQESWFWIQFTETTVCDEALAWAMVLHTSYSAFAAKYYYGFPRPEEVFHTYANGWYEVKELHGNILNYIINEDEILADARSFTTYPEWAPTHPSRPAMHSSVASIIYMANILYDLDEYEKDQILRLQSNMAFGRTFAWVHRPYDNIIGINLWIEIMKNGLMKDLMDSSWILYNEDILNQAISENDMSVEYVF